MSVLTENPVLITDGDAAFTRVNNRVPAHALSPGEMAAATNLRIENGKPGPRYGVAVDAWGLPGTNLATGELYSASITDAGDDEASVYATISGLTIGQEYKLWFGNATLMSFTIVSSGGVYPTGSEIAYLASNNMTSSQAGGTLVTNPYTFTATTTEIYLFTNDDFAGMAVSAILTTSGANTCAYKRFNDPTTNTDNGILITDDWRSDGGRGRAWRIKPGYVPVEIPLNGHDVWGKCQLIQCDNAMVLLRQGDERHYFGASDWDDPLNDRITLNVAPSWGTGIANAKVVRFQLASDDAQITGQTQNITDTDLAANTITVASHGLVDGTAKKVTGLTGLSGVYYVAGQSASTLRLYDTAANAITDDGVTGLINITVDDQTGTLADLPPAPNSTYYANRVSGSIIELYFDAAGATKVLYSTVTAPTGKFYIELATSPAPFYGNGAPPLILQPTATQDAFEVGFVAVTSEVLVTDSDATADTITAMNHRLTPGDQVTATLSTDTFTAKFAYPVSEHAFKLYATAAQALAGGATGLENVTAGSQTGTVKKTSAAGLPMPPGRVGCYYKGRLIIVNQRDRILISDPYDFLHFTSFLGNIAANLGESGQANWLCPLGEDALLIGKDLKILAISGLSGASTGWRMDDVTDEYGGIAQEGVLNVGTDVWCFSRKGVASIQRTVAGERLGELRTVSEDIPMDMATVDWTQATQAAFAVWNNRFFCAAPGKDQNPVINNRTFVFNFLNRNKRVQQTEIQGEIVGRVVDTDGEPNAWEGTWTGDLLTPYAFARLTVNAEERLTFATPYGEVYWLHDGWDDNGGELESVLTTRGYFGGRHVLALKTAITWETYRPKLSVVAKAAGYKEEWTLLSDEEYDSTESTVAGGATYNPATSTEAEFNAPHRSDYAVSAEDLLVGEPDVHQNSTRNLRLRVRDRSVQLRITNTQGSARIVGTTIQGKPVGISAGRKT